MTGMIGCSSSVTSLFAPSKACQQLLLDAVQGSVKEALFWVPSQHTPSFAHIHLSYTTNKSSDSTSRYHRQKQTNR
jgi:hypothetical protein